VAGVFFLAQTIGIKHVAVFGGIPLGLFFAYGVWKQPRRWAAAAAVVLVFLAFGTFWTIRTTVLTGNPAFPEAPQRAVNGATLSHGRSMSQKIVRYVELPWTILFQGRSTFESPLTSPAGIILLAFFPLIFFQPAWRNKALLACCTFAVIYFAYWSSILSTLRYAIVPFAILAVVVAGGAARFYDSEASRVVRGSLLALEVYGLLVAVLGMIIIEVNVPQLAYFAGRLDKPGYLRAALQTYKPLEFLQGVAPLGAGVFGIDNCSRAYAPNPLQFHCALCPPTGCDPEHIAAGLKDYQPRYVIVPEHTGVAAALDFERHSSRIYHDDDFSVYELR
jgi:hypothetical protein